MKIAIFPGSFDPMHAGHLNIIVKALKLFDKIYVVVSKNWHKANQNSMQDRIKQVSQMVEKLPNVIVIANENDFTYNIANKVKAQFIIRGLRNNDDFAYELELNYANKQFNDQLETIYFVADFGLSHLSSTIEREIKMIEKSQESNNDFNSD